MPDSRKPEQKPEPKSACVVLWIFCERCHVRHERGRGGIASSDAVFRLPPPSDLPRPFPLPSCPRCAATDVWLRWAPDA